MREISGSPARAGRRTRTGGIDIPRWFAHELALIDAEYYVDWDLHGYYKIVLDTYQLVDVGRKIIRVKYPLIRAVFDSFDRRVLDDLKKRKWINRNFGSNERYYRWLKEKEREDKAKQKDVSDDMITEGIMKMDRMERTKTFT